MNPARWLPALFLAALALRLHGSDWLPLTCAEAGGASRGLLLPVEEILTARWISAVLGALGITIVFGLFPPRHSRLICLCGALLLILDPLSLAAGREAGPGGALVLSSALLCWLVAAPPARNAARVGLLLVLLLSIGAWLPADRAAAGALPLDATLGAWSSVCGDFFGPLCALLHQLGYSLVPLALIGLVRPGGRRLILLLPLLLLAAFLVDGGPPRRLIAFAGAAPVLLALLLMALDHLASRDRPAGGLPLSALGAAGLILAVNLPVLVSDLRGGQRFPWPPALRRLEQIEPALPADAPIYTTIPGPLERQTDRPVRRLPEAPDAIRKLLAEARPLVLLLPLEGGQLQGAGTPGLLSAVEAVRVASFEVRVKRFDLYRFELRAFVFAD